MRERFDKQHGKRAQALLKSTSQHLYHIHWSLPSQLSWKTSLLLTCQILGLLLNILAGDEKYPVLNRDNLTIPVQMHDTSLIERYQFDRTFWQATWQTCLRTVEICITAPLSNWLITAKWIELENVSLIDMLNLATAF